MVASVGVGSSFAEKMVGNGLEMVYVRSDLPVRQSKVGKEY